MHSPRPWLSWVLLSGVLLVVDRVASGQGADVPAPGTPATPAGATVAAPPRALPPIAATALPLPNASAFSPLVSNPPSSPGPGVNHELLNRLDQAEAEIRALRARLSKPSAVPAGPSGVVPAGYAASLPPVSGISPGAAVPTLARDLSAEDPPTTAAALEAGYRERLDAAAGSAELASPGPTLHVVGTDNKFELHWNHGLEAVTKHKDFRIHVGGRSQYDATFFSADEQVQTGIGGFGRLQDSVNPRRGRLRIDGTLWEVIDFVAEYDFVNDFATPVTIDGVVPFPAVTEMHVTLTKLPVVGNLRVGNMKDPISFEHLTSSRWLNFLERSPGFDAFYGRFTNGFVPGAMLFNWNESERMTGWVGVFKNGSNPAGFGVGDGEWNFETRLTGLPIYEAEGRRLVHLGGSFSYRDPDNGRVRFVSRGNIRSGPPGPLNPVYADTLPIAATGQQILNAEFFSVLGPLTLQSEYSASFLNNAVYPVPPAAGTPRGTVFFQQTYVEALWFLTGEHRGYLKRLGQPDRVIPFENFFLVRGPHGALSGRGAWQVGVRYSYLDLSNSGIEGGILHGITAGLNWFLNPNLKFQWNYDWTRRDAFLNTSDGDIHGFGMRMAMDF